MIGLNETAAPAAAPTASTASSPSAGRWVLLKVDAPWLKAFPSGWVPVMDTLPLPLPEVEFRIGWRVDVSRCSHEQLTALGAVLEARGLVSTVAEFMANMNDCKTVAVGPVMVQQAHDFDKHICAIVEFYKLEDDNAKE